MNPRDSNEMLKEKLRMQAMELKKRDAEKEKGDAKVKHILKLSKEKIKDLTETVAKSEKNSETDEKLSQEIEKSQKVIKLLKEKLEESKQENSELVEKLGSSSPEESNTEKKDPKLVKALKKLKLKNQALEEKLTEKEILIEETGGKTNVEDKEKKMMEAEIKRLREQPDAQKALKKKFKKLKQDNEKKLEKYKKVIKEKSEQIASYEKVLYGKDDKEGEGTKVPSEMIQEMKETLATLEGEKADLEKQLNGYKEDFKTKLEAEVKKLHEEFADELANANKPGKGGGGECPPCEEGAPEWMATFADMVTLLMVFFVLMYAIASKNISTVKSVLAGEEDASVGVLELMDAVEVKESISSLTGMKSDDILSKMEEVAEHSSLEVENDGPRIIFRVPGGTLFPPGKANLNLSARPVLDEVIRVVNKYPKYKIHIQGHTDDEPISSAMFPTNWELSAGRATAVLRYFIDRGAEPERMTATGYADTFPLARNDIVEGRARNRRVEFVLEKK